MTKNNEIALMECIPEPEYEYIYQDEDGNIIPVYYQYEEETENNIEYQYTDGLKDGEIFQENYNIEEFGGESFIYESTSQVNEIQQQQISQDPGTHIDDIINVVAHGDIVYEETKKRKGPTIKECEYCGLTLKYPSKIAAHMRTHTGERPYSCKYCRQTFTQRTPWKSHLKRHEGDTPFKCSYCSKAFPNPSTCKAHIKRVHLKKPKAHPGQIINSNISCQKRNEDETQKSQDVEETIATKTLKECLKEQEKQVYICQVCGIHIRHPSKVSSHMLTHRGYKYKPFQCQFCGLLLTTFSSHNVHIKRFHSAEKPYSCQWECGKAFPTQSNRNEHEKIVHHKIKRYQCCINNCNKLFTRRFYLCKHFTKCHSDWELVPDEVKGNRVVAIPFQEEEKLPEQSTSKPSLITVHSDGTKYLVQIMGPLGQPPFHDPAFVENEFINFYSSNNEDLEETSSILEPENGEIIVQNDQDLEEMFC
uniref:C2H2-type domain-containing protein n=1 Tax=Panagrolaimus superbus TaxID=310955 RepID=A0A914YMI9_9BILA